MSDTPFQQIDDLIHAKARLGIMSLVMAYGACEFTFLKKQLNLSDGNLGSHLRKLENANYIYVEKKIQFRKPKTTCRPTKEGVRAYKKYIRTLEKILYTGDEDTDDKAT